MEIKRYYISEDEINNTINGWLNDEVIRDESDIFLSLTMTLNTENIQMKMDMDMGIHYREMKKIKCFGSKISTFSFKKSDLKNIQKYELLLFESLRKHNKENIITIKENIYELNKKIESKENIIDIDFLGLQRLEKLKRITDA